MLKAFCSSLKLFESLWLEIEGLLTHTRQPGYSSICTCCACMSPTYLRHCCDYHGELGLCTLLVRIAPRPSHRHHESLKLTYVRAWSM